MNNKEDYYLIGSAYYALGEWALYGFPMDGCIEVWFESFCVASQLLAEELNLA